MSGAKLAMRVAVSPRSTSRMLAALAAVSFVLVLLAGCRDRGVEPKEYCAEAISGAGEPSCAVDYDVCSDSFACDFRVECAPEGAKTVCRCVSTGADCHGDALTFETAELCGAAKTDRARLRELVIEGCRLGADSDFSRIP